MLIEQTLFGEVDKVKAAIELLQKHEPPEGYYLCFSGGKDSVVIYDLAIKSGVKFDAHHNITTVEPPQLMKFIRDFYPNVTNDRPPLTMHALIVKKTIPPLRQMRYCCKYLKERGGQERFKITGIRSEEAPRRAKRPQLDTSHDGKSSFLHVIKDCLPPTFGNTFTLTTCPIASFTTKALTVLVAYFVLLKTRRKQNATWNASLLSSTTTAELAANLLKSIVTKSRIGLRAMICSTGGLTSEKADTSPKIVIQFLFSPKMTALYFKEA